MNLNLDDIERTADAGIRHDKPCSITGEELKGLVSIARACVAVRSALKLARLHIKDTPTEHATVSLDYMGVGLGEYLDAVIAETE
jgi:hypothetical protein